MTSRNTPARIQSVPDRTETLKRLNRRTGPAHSAPRRSLTPPPHRVQHTAGIGITGACCILSELEDAADQTRRPAMDITVSLNLTALARYLLFANSRRPEYAEIRVELQSSKPVQLRKLPGGTMDILTPESGGLLITIRLPPGLLN